MVAAARSGAAARARSSCIEREIGLRNYIESGIPLDAQVTYDLLVTIFQPRRRCTTAPSSSRRTRIAAASCFLPLTVNPVLSASSAPGIAPPSASPRRTTRWRWSCPRRAAEISIALDGTIERGLTAGPAEPAPDLLQRADRQARRRRRVGRHPVRWPTIRSATWAQVTSDRAGRRDLADRRRSARRATDGGCRSSTTTCPPNLEIVASPPRKPSRSCACAARQGTSAAAGRRGRRGARSDAARPGTRLFHLRTRRGAGAVRRRGRPGDPADDAADFEFAGSASCRSSPASTASRRRAIRRAHHVVAASGGSGRAHQPRRRRRQRDDRAGVGRRRVRDVADTSSSASNGLVRRVQAQTARTVGRDRAGPVEQVVRACRWRSANLGRASGGAVDPPGLDVRGARRSSARRRRHHGRRLRRLTGLGPGRDIDLPVSRCASTPTSGQVTGAVRSGDRRRRSE